MDCQGVQDKAKGYTSQGASQACLTPPRTPWQSIKALLSHSLATGTEEHQDEPQDEWAAADEQPADEQRDEAVEDELLEECVSSDEQQDEAADEQQAVEDELLELIRRLPGHLRRRLN